MEKKVKIGDKEYTVKEISYIEAVEVNPGNKQETIRKLFKSAIGLTDEEINKLSFREGIELQKAVNEVNGLNEEDFTTPTGNE